MAPPGPVILWGARGHAKVLNEFLPRLGFPIVAIFDNDPAAVSPVENVPLYHGLAGLEEWRKSVQEIGSVRAVVAIGGQRGQARIQIQQQLSQLGIPPLTVIHPTAFVAEDAEIGVGTQILANTAICAEAVIGDSCIVNTGASIDHESVLGNGVHVAPGCTVAGCVTIGDRSMIAAGATVLPYLKIGSDTVIGAGAVVTRDIAAGKVAYGNPAKVIRNNED